MYAYMYGELYIYMIMICIWSVLDLAPFQTHAVISRAKARADA